MSRWQYQGKAEVISTEKERTQPDKWLPSFPDLIFRKSVLPAAILAGSLFFCSIPPVENITPDKWQPRYVDTIPAKPALSRAIQAGSFFLGDIPRSETITLDKWIPSFPDRIARPRKTVEFNPPFIYVPPVAETIYADKWLPQRPDHISRVSLSRAILAGSFFIGDIPRKETPQMDKWAGLWPAILPARPTLPTAVRAPSLFWIYKPAVELITTYAATLIAMPRDLSLRATTKDLALKTITRILSIEASVRNTALRAGERLLHLIGRKRN